MNKAFITLYALIVISVITIGLGINEIWERQQGNTSTESPHAQIIQLSELFLTSQASTPSPETIKQLESLIPYTIEAISLNDITQKSILARLEKGEIIYLKDQQNNDLIYKKVTNQPLVLSFSQSPIQDTQSSLRLIFLLAFYLAIAVVIFFWVWPLSRDLRQLEKHTETLAKGKLGNRISIKPVSTVYKLAQAYNTMAERIQSLVKSHKDMTHAVSHELRTPLARMKFALEMAEQNDDLARIKKQIIGTRSDVSEMDSLVNTLLHYASLEERDNQALDQKSGDMSYLAQQLIDRAKRNAPKPVTFEFVDTTGNGHMVCDWHLMERALFNLLQNASRFAKQYIRLTLSSDSKQFGIIVEDDGPGVPEQELNRIFESFIRLNNQGNTKTSGFGLGLAIVRRVATWHDGKVTAERSEMGGAKFELTWPNAIRLEQ